jgi:oxygen-independent coproporphyrinogen-3 oxidase
LEYYGFGLSSSGYIGNIRYTNTRSINKYLKHNYIKNNGIEELSIKDKIVYEIILNLRTSTGIDLDYFNILYRNKLDELYDYKEMINRGLLVEENNHLKIPKDLWYISNSIIVELLEHEI